MPKTLDWDIVARPRAVCGRITDGVSPVHVARLVGLRHRRAGRHGVPHLQPAVHGAQHARPRAVEAECSEHNGDSYPRPSKIKFEFPSWRPAAFTLYWYDGGNLPPEELFADVRSSQDRRREVCRRLYRAAA